MAEQMKKMHKVKLDTAEPELPEFKQWMHEHGIVSNFSMRDLPANELEVEYFGSKENLLDLINVWWDRDNFLKSLIVEA